MGSRGKFDTPLGILAALIEQRTVRQDELAKRLGVKAETLRKHLLALEAHGLPLERDTEGGHVYWSVPSEWGPGGLLLEGAEVGAIVKLLSRLPRGAERDRALDRLGARITSDVVGREALERRLEVIASQRVADEEQRTTDLVEEAATRRTSLRMRYFSMVRGELAWRHVSVQRVMPHVRFVGRCHRDDQLKWFRIANVVEASLDPNVPYRATPAAEVDAYVAASVGGFATREPTTEHVFEVRAPESTWVIKNLPPASVEVVHLDRGAVRVTMKSAALALVARFVLGLGGAAVAVTPELRDAVRGLALRALDAHGRETDER